MAQIVYRGNVYAGGNGSVGQVNLTARIQDPTEMELTEGQINGTEPIEGTTTYDQNGNANVDITLPVSLIINNGVLVNDAQKNMIFKNTQEVNEIALDKGYRYVYGDGGKRFIWQGLRVLFGKTKVINSTDVTYFPGDNIYEYTWSRNDSHFSLLPDDTSTDDPFLIQNFITPDDLYTSIPFLGNVDSVTTGTTYVTLTSKTQQNMQFKIKLNDRSHTATCGTPINTTSAGIFLYCQDFNSSGANIRVGFASFENDTLLACYPWQKIYASANDYWIGTYSWGSTAEFEAACGITAKYSHVTQAEFEQISGISLGD